jgi:hypothetical protein
MAKQLLLSFLPLFTIAFLSTGCEQTRSVPEKKIPIENYVSEEKTPSTQTMPVMKEVETTDDKKESVTSNEPLTTDKQIFEGSKTLKRYLDDSTL